LMPHADLSQNVPCMPPLLSLSPLAGRGPG
jgi:hypothetical protein